MAKYDVTFDYFHGYESEQFAFYRIPKVLFTDDYFRNLSSDAMNLVRSTINEHRKRSLELLKKVMEESTDEK